MKTLLRLRKIIKFDKKSISYIQGQSPEPKIRDYFYYIDHQGMLFLDDARIKNFTSCFKEKQFLEFFFKRLRKNTTDRYSNEFPYLSLCGRERNFVKCDDLPIVYTHVVQTKQGEEYLAYGHAGDLLKVRFEPEKIFMSPVTGRVYHPAAETIGGIGLVRSKLAIEFSKHFKFGNGEQMSPTEFHWKDRTYTLDNEWYLKYGEYRKFQTQ